MENQPALSYQQASARGASPVGQVVSLYDTILRDLRRAQAAFESGNVESRVFELNHALTVIAHLQSVLDHEHGIEAAKRFESLYQVTRAMIVELNACPSRESFQKLVDLYGAIRQAWQEVERNLPAGSQELPIANPPSAARTPAKAGMANQQDNIADESHGSWSA